MLYKGVTQPEPGIATQLANKKYYGRKRIV
jgi:hypothetical protein